MEKLVYCDTHVVVGLYDDKLPLFGRHAIRLLEDGQLLMSPVVILELEYLYEIGKIKTDARRIFGKLEEIIGLKICNQDFIKVVEESLKQSWTRDPFDRLIVAQAAVTKSPLITKDEFIHKHYAHAVWD